MTIDEMKVLYKKQLDGTITEEEKNNLFIEIETSCLDKKVLLDILKRDL